MTKTELEQKIKEFAENIFFEGFQDGQQYELDHTPIDVEDAYQSGLNDAWECAKKIANMSEEEYKKVTGRDFKTGILGNISASEAIKKVKQYEESKFANENNTPIEIKVGDEVGGSGVVTRIKDEIVYVLWKDGSCGDFDKKYLVRTGKHYPQISEVLSQMKGETDGN